MYEASCTVSSPRYRAPLFHQNGSSSVIFETDIVHSLLCEITVSSPSSCNHDIILGHSLGHISGRPQQEDSLCYCCFHLIADAWRIYFNAGWPPGTICAVMRLNLLLRIEETLSCEARLQYVQYVALKRRGLP